jgi:hypothetical protein
MRAKAAYGHRVITPRSARRTSAALLGCAVLLGGCAANTESASPLEPTSAATSASVSPEAEPSPTLSPTPTPTPTPDPTSPLTGEINQSPKPVLVVKLDNTRNAQPHSGLINADVVYIEEVEYGITRLAAVFSSKIPGRIGPVRSARITDIDLLEQFGSPAFAFSGVQSKMWPVIGASSLIDISPNKMAQAYFRDQSRRAPYNYFLDGEMAIAQTPKASLDKDIGFVFSDTAPPSEMPGLKASMEWSYASARFVYDPASGLYKVFLNGERAQADEDQVGQRAATVIIQNVEQNPSAYNDKGGGNTPHAETIGTGTATVLRDGMAYEVTWNRPDIASGTTFTQADGTPMPFKPGQQWVVLLDEERPATIRPKPLTQLEKLANRTTSSSPSAVAAN